jgi:hypothetical protein
MRENPDGTFPFSVSLDTSDLATDTSAHADLAQSLQEAGFRGHPGIASVPRGKGAAELLVLVLSSSASIRALERTLRAWLDRSRRRKIDILIGEGKKAKKISVEASSASDETVQAIVEAILAWRDDIDPK